jgi:histidine triad (HIT) family protein
MSSDDCLFCKIISGDIQADVIYENEAVIGFRDINPKAPTHVLLIPRKHIATINDIDVVDEPAVGQLYTAAKQIAEQEGLAADGYRVVMNCNEAAGQTVFHIHLHLLGGRAFTWPPG